MEYKKIFEPVGRSSKKGQKHRHVMNVRAKIMRNNIPVIQDIATHVVKEVCNELNIGRVKPEKPLFCKSNRRWYIADIYIPSLRLVIEIDGSSHDKKEKYDKERNEVLLVKGIETVRFKNDEVLNLEFIEKVKNILNEKKNQLESTANLKPTFVVQDAEQIFGKYDTFKEAKCLASLLNRPVEVWECCGDIKRCRIRLKKWGYYKKWNKNR